jgi:hypothetical protein
VDNINNQLTQSIDNVKELLHFDDIILQICISGLEQVEKNLRSSKISNPNLLPGKTIATLKSIKVNGSLATKYEVMYNQCLVLLVSHFTAVIHDLFLHAIKIATQNEKEILFQDQALKISISELRMMKYNIVDNLGNILIKKKEIRRRCPSTRSPSTRATMR